MVAVEYKCLAHESDAFLQTQFSSKLRNPTESDSKHAGNIGLIEQRPSQDYQSNRFCIDRYASAHWTVCIGNFSSLEVSGMALLLYPRQRFGLSGNCKTFIRCMVCLMQSYCANNYPQRWLYATQQYWDN